MSSKFEASGLSASDLALAPEHILATVDFIVANNKPPGFVIGEEHMEEFNTSLMQLVKAADDVAKTHGLINRPTAPRWTPVARIMVRQCERLMLVPGGTDKTMLFEDSNYEMQNDLLRESKVSL